MFLERGCAPSRNSAPLLWRKVNYYQVSYFHSNDIFILRGAAGKRHGGLLDYTYTGPLLAFGTHIPHHGFCKF